MGCEVVVYTAEHELTLADLPRERVKLLIDVWADRYRELGARAGADYVFIFENKGKEMGVSLSHPHGQIYALPFVPPIPRLELDTSRRHAAETGSCLHCAEIEDEAAGPCRLFDQGGMLAFVPRAPRAGRTRSTSTPAGTSPRSAIWMTESAGSWAGRCFA